MEILYPVSRLLVLLAAAFATAASPAAGPGERFEAFSWIHVPNADSRWRGPNVSTMVEIAPWTTIPDAARRLKALPPGDRWVMLFIVTDDMANHPSDRCVRQRVELQTTYVDAAPTPSQSSKARTARGAALTKQAPPVKVPVTRRVVTRQMTEFRGPWIDNGVAATRSRMQAIMNGLKAAGAEVDGVIVDNETTLDAAHFMGRTGSLAAIEADPRWPALAASLGLPRSLSGMSWGNSLYFAWTKVMSGRFDQALGQAVHVPIKTAFPNAVVSNYCSGNIAAQAAWPDINGHVDVRSTPGFGTHDSHEFYGWLAPGRVAKVAGGSDTSDAFMALRLEVFKIRGMNASSSRPKHAWIASKSWSGETWGRVPLKDSAMWDELVMQLALNGIEDFLHFSPYLPADPWAPGEAFLSRITQDHDSLEAVLAELNAAMGDATGRPLGVAQPTWGERVIASGRVVGDEVVWRFSFDAGIDSVTVTFSDGASVRIDREPGRSGAWFRHPAARSLRMEQGGRPVISEQHADSDPPQGSSGAGPAA
jgi:hypothetical protein